MDLNPATSTAPQEKWFHLVVRDNGSDPDSGCPHSPQYGIFGIDHANPSNMIPLGPDSGLSPHRLAAVEKFTECINAMKGAGLSIYCPCQLKGASGATVPTLFAVPGGERAVNTGRRVSVPDETEPTASVRSRPLAEQVVSVQGEARSAPGSSIASVNRNEQIAKDYIFARQLHDQLNKSSTDQSLLRQHSLRGAGNTEVSASQIGQSDGSSSSLADRINLSPLAWSTVRYYY